MLEASTLASFTVTVSATITATAAVYGARYVRDAKDNSEQALRVLTGEPGIDDGGIVNDVRDHRKTLLAAGLYPPTNANEPVTVEDASNYDLEGLAGGDD